MANTSEEILAELRRNLAAKSSTTTTTTTNRSSAWIPVSNWNMAPSVRAANAKKPAGPEPKPAATTLTVTRKASTTPAAQRERAEPIQSVRRTTPAAAADSGIQTVAARAGAFSPRPEPDMETVRAARQPRQVTQQPYTLEQLRARGVQKSGIAIPEPGDVWGEMVRNVRDAGLFQKPSTILPDLPDVEVIESGKYAGFPRYGNMNQATPGLNGWQPPNDDGLRAAAEKLRGLDPLLDRQMELARRRQTTGWANEQGADVHPEFWRRQLSDEADAKYKGWDAFRAGAGDWFERVFLNDQWTKTARIDDFLRSLGPNPAAMIGRASILGSNMALAGAGVEGDLGSLTVPQASSIVLGPVGAQINPWSPDSVWAGAGKWLKQGTDRADGSGRLTENPLLQIQATGRGAIVGATFVPLYNLWTGYMNGGNEAMQFLENNRRMQEAPPEVRNYLNMAQLTPNFGTGAQAQAQTIDDLETKLTVPAMRDEANRLFLQAQGLEQQAVTALAAGDSAKAALLRTQAGQAATAASAQFQRANEWDAKTWDDIIYQRQDILGEMGWGVALDPLNVVDPWVDAGFGAVWGGIKSLYRGTKGNVPIEELAKAVQEGYQIAGALEAGLDVTKLSKRGNVLAPNWDVFKASPVEAIGNWFRHLVERTPESEAHRTASDLLGVMSRVFNGVDNVADAQRILDTLLTEPQKLVTGLDGLTGNYFKQSGGVLRVGEDVLLNPEVARRLPVLQVAADALRKATALADPKQTLDVPKLWAEFDSALYRSTRRVLGASAIDDLPIGAASMQVLKVAPKAFNAGASVKLADGSFGTVVSVDEAAQTVTVAGLRGEDTIRPGSQAIWRNGDVDTPVTITGVAGKADGQWYYTIEGSKTGIPESQIMVDPAMRMGKQTTVPISQATAVKVATGADAKRVVKGDLVSTPQGLGIVEDVKFGPGNKTVTVRHGDQVMPHLATEVQVYKPVKAQGERAVILFKDQDGGDLATTTLMSPQEAKLYEKHLTAAIKAGYGDKIMKAIDGLTAVQRGFLSDMWLRLRPGHWVRNATSATAALMADGIYSIETIPQIIDDFGKFFPGSFPTERVMKAFTNTDNSEHWTRAQLRWKSKNPYAAGMDALNEVWSGMTSILGRVPFGEQAFYVRALHKSFMRGIAEEWTATVGRTLDVWLREFGAPVALRKDVVAAIAATGARGGKDAIRKKLSEMLASKWKDPNLRGMGIPAEVFSLDGELAMEDVLKEWQRTSRQADDPKLMEAIDSIIRAEMYGPAERLRVAPPQPTVGDWTFAEIAEDAAGLATRLGEYMMRSGMPADVAQAQAFAFAQEIAKKESDAWTSLVLNLQQTASPGAMNVAFDLMAEVYEKKEVARRAVDMLSRAAVEGGSDALWKVKWEQTQALYTKLSDDVQGLFAQAGVDLGRVLNGEEVPRRYRWDAAVQRYLDWDEQVFRDARTIELGGVDDTERELWQKVIDANRQFVDRQYVAMFEAFRKYPSVEALDVIRSTMKQTDIEGARAAAFLQPLRDELGAAKARKARNFGALKAEYQRIRNATWNGMFDNQASYVLGGTQAIIADGLGKKNVASLRWQPANIFEGHFLDDGTPTTYVLVGATDWGTLAGYDLNRNVMDYFGLPGGGRNLPVLPSPVRAQISEQNVMAAVTGAEKVPNLIEWVDEAGATWTLQQYDPVHQVWHATSNRGDYRIFSENTRGGLPEVPRNVYDNWLRITDQAQQQAAIDGEIDGIRQSAQVTPVTRVNAGQETPESVSGINTPVAPVSPQIDAVSPVRQAAGEAPTVDGGQLQLADAWWADLPEELQERMQRGLPIEEPVRPVPQAVPRVVREEFRGVMKAAYNLNDEMADMMMPIADGRAAVWARQTGREAAEWYPAHIASVQRGGDAGAGALFQRLDLDTPEFRQWFGDSVVRESDGAPKVMYHGTATGDFDTFDVEKQNPESLYGPGFYFTEEPKVAAGTVEDKVFTWYFATKQEADDFIEREGIRNSSTITPPRNAARGDKFQVTSTAPMLRQKGYAWRNSDKIPIEERPALLDGFLRMLETRQFEGGETTTAALRKRHSELANEWARGEAESTWLLTEWLDKQVAGPGSTYPVYLTISKPFDADLVPTADDVQRYLAALDDDARDLLINGEQMDDTLIEWNEELGQYIAAPNVTNGDILRELYHIDEITPFDARKWFNDLGYDGITHIGGANTGTAPHRVYIAFDPGQIKSAIANRGTWDAANPSMLAQAGVGAAKGSTEFLDDGRAILRGLTAPDVSTAVHELAHVFRRDLADVAKIDARAADDMRVLEAWARVRNGTWTVEAEEQFARGFERYLAEGVAPSPALQGAFSRFRQWLAQIYRSLQNIFPKNRMSPQVRGVFDRLLADMPDVSKMTPELQDLVNWGEEAGIRGQYMRKGDGAERTQVNHLINAVNKAAEEAGLPWKMPGAQSVDAWIKANPQEYRQAIALLRERAGRIWNETPTGERIVDLVAEFEQRRASLESLLEMYRQRMAEGLSFRPGALPNEEALYLRDMMRRAERVQGQLDAHNSSLTALMVRQGEEDEVAEAAAEVTQVAPQRPVEAPRSVEAAPAVPETPVAQAGGVASEFTEVRKSSEIRISDSVTGREAAIKKQRDGTWIVSDPKERRIGSNALPEADAIAWARDYLQARRRAHDAVQKPTPPPIEAAPAAPPTTEAPRIGGEIDLDAPVMTAQGNGTIVGVNRKNGVLRTYDVELDSGEVVELPVGDVQARATEETLDEMEAAVNATPYSRPVLSAEEWHIDSREMAYADALEEWDGKKPITQELWNAYLLRQLRAGRKPERSMGKLLDEMQELGMIDERGMPLRDVPPRSAAPEAPPAPQPQGVQPARINATVPSGVVVPEAPVAPQIAAETQGAARVPDVAPENVVPAAAQAAKAGTVPARSEPWQPVNLAQDTYEKYVALGADQDTLQVLDTFADRPNGLVYKANVQKLLAQATDRMGAQQVEDILYGRKVADASDYDEVIDNLTEPIDRAPESATIEAGGGTNAEAAEQATEPGATAIAEPGSIDAADNRPLAEVQAGDGGEDVGARIAGDGGERSAADAGSLQATDAGRDEPVGSVRRDETGVVPTAGDAGAGRTLDVEPERRADVEAGTIEQPAPIEGTPRYDYAITDRDGLESFGGAKSRYRNNVDAIKLLRKLQEEGRKATQEEQQVLVRFSGWGSSSLAQNLFGNWPDRSWQSEWDAIKKLLSPEEWKRAANSTANAHYTAPVVIKGIYQGLGRLGIQNLPTIRMLEPSAGIGNFLGLMPGSWANKADRVAIELDPVTGGILGNLYQKAKVFIGGFEEVPMPDNFFDLVISNFPFGNYRVFDPKWSKGKLSYLTRSIHNYFFAKSLEKVRPGGLVVGITSHYTLDGVKATRFRQHMADQADLVAAFRLPRTAFKENADTEVVTDIIILRKRLPGELPGDQSWVNVETRGVDDQGIGLNKYYGQHPENILGTESMTGKMHGRNEYTVLPREGTTLDQEIAAAMQRLPENIIKPFEVEVDALQNIMVRNQFKVKNGGLAIVDGKVKRARVGGFDNVEIKNEGDFSRIKGQLEIRDAARKVIAVQQTDGTDEELAAAQAELARLYDAFTSKYGAISSSKNKAVMSKDPDGYFLLGLERTADGKTFTKADIFSKRLVYGRPLPTKAASAVDALAVSLRERGRIDTQYMQQLYGKQPEEIMQELGDLAYQDPYGDWETASKYLSGDVRLKLHQAEQAVKQNPAFQRNVDALKALQPRDLLPSEVTANVGSNWIPGEVYEAFAREMMGGQWKIQFSDQIGWLLENEGSAAARIAQWGTADVGGDELLRNLFESKQPTIFDTWMDGNTVKKAINPSKTRAAINKQAALNAEFTRWLWRSDHADDMLKRYNDLRNVWVAPRADGSHLGKLQGVASNFFDLRPNQNNAIWRVLSNGNTLLAHEVGAGKTFTMIGAAMEMKRLGLAHKSMIVVPNEIASQWALDIKKMYPFANVIAPDLNDMDAAARKELMAQIATGDYDIVLMVQSQLKKLPLKPETQAKFMDDELEDFRDALEMAEAKMRAEHPGASDKEMERLLKRDQNVKKLRKFIMDTEAKMKAQMELPRDDTMFFEDLGIDAILVDEAQDFKNLAFATNRPVQVGDADRAMDLFLKTKWINELTNYRNVVFATGTPITNSIAEAWTLMRYLMPDSLEMKQMRRFDDWATQFGTEVTKWEWTATGRQQRTRFNRFVNVPEMNKMMQQVMDVFRWKDMPWLKLPKMKTGGRIIHVADDNEAYTTIREALRDRALEINRRKGPPKKGDDIILAVIGDANAAAVDPRLYDSTLPDLPGTKVAQLIDEVVRIHFDPDVAKNRGTQLIFADIGVPGGGKPFNLYDDIKRKLVARGVPEKEIAYIHDAAGDDDVLELIKARVNDGEVRVLIGSTEKMGRGMNVQERAYALHHVSGKYRPDHILQREGRIIRQGNQFKEVEVHVYVQPPLDSIMWGKVTDKLGNIEKAIQREVTDRTMEDVDEIMVDFSMITSQATGDPLYTKYLEVQQLYDNMDADYQSFTNQNVRLRSNARQAEQRAQSLRSQLSRVESDIRASRPTRAGITEYIYVGDTYVKKDDAVKEIDKLLKETIAKSDTGDNGRLFQYRGMNFEWRVEALSGGGRRVGIKAFGQYADPGSASHMWSWAFSDTKKQNPKSILDTVEDYLDNQLPAQAEGLRKNAEKAATDAQELAQLAERNYERFDEYVATKAELDRLSAELQGDATASEEALNEAASMRERWPTINRQDISTAARLGPPEAGYSRTTRRFEIDGELWFYEDNGSMWAGRKLYDTGYIKDGKNTEEAAKLLDTTNAVELQPLSVLKAEGRNKDALRRLVLGNKEAQIAVINARFYGEAMRRAEAAGETLRILKAPDSSGVIFMAGEQKIGVADVYKLNDTEMSDVMRRHYPGAVDGTVEYAFEVETPREFGAAPAGPIDWRTMFGARNLDDVKKRAQGIGKDIRAYWRKPKQEEMGDVALHQVRTLEDARKRIIDSLPDLAKPRDGRLPAGVQKELMDRVDRVLLPAHDNAVYGAMKSAQAAADGAMLNYQDRRGFDTLLGYVFPFSYYWTRGGMQWAKRLARKPALANMIYEAQRQVDLANERGDVPNRLKGTIFVRQGENGKYYLRNPMEYILPSYFFMPNRFDNPDQARGPAEKAWLQVQQMTPGFHPLPDIMMAAGMDAMYGVQPGEHGALADYTLRGFVPLAGIAMDARQAMTGDAAGTWTGGDRFNQYRVRRSIGVQAEQQQFGEQDRMAAQYARQIALNLEQGKERYTDVPKEFQQRADEIYRDASKQAGKERLLSSATGWGLGNTAYYVPDAEMELQRQNQEYQDAGYSDANPAGSAEARRAVLEANPNIPLTWGNSVTEGERTPAQSAEQSRMYSDLEKNVYGPEAEEITKAITDALAAGKGDKEIGALVADIKAKYYDLGQEVRAKYPNQPPAGLGGPAAGSNPWEQAIDQLTDILNTSDLAYPEYPGDNATQAQKDEYYRLRNDYYSQKASLIAKRIDAAMYTSQMDPKASESDLILADMLRRVPVDTLEREFKKLKYASEAEVDWKRAADAREAEITNAMMTMFGDARMKEFEHYNSLTGEARSKYNDDKPYLAAMSVMTYHPDEYRRAIETFGEEAWLAWANRPVGEKGAYYDQYPDAFLVNAWIYGRYDDALGSDLQKLASSTGDVYDFGKDYEEAMRKFGDDIWKIVTDYSSSWSKKQKSAYIKAHQVITDFWDWWYGPKETGDNYRSGYYRSNYKRYYKRYSRRSYGGYGGYSRSSYGGYSGGGGGYTPYVRMPEVWNRDMDKNLRRDFVRNPYQFATVAGTGPYWMEAGENLKPGRAPEVERWQPRRVWK